MRGTVWLVLFTLVCAPALVYARDAPLMAFLSPQASTNALRAPSPEALAPRGPKVSAYHAASRLTHHCGSDGVPEVCKMDALVYIQADAHDSDTFAKWIGSEHALRKWALQAPHQLVLPSVDQSNGSFLDALRNEIRTKCTTWRTATDVADADPKGGSWLITLSAKEATRALDAVKEAFPSHAVVISAPPARTLTKRYIPVQPVQMQAHGKFLERYQLFSSTTVLSLGVASFLIFFTLIAVSFLSSTQTPDKLGASKTVSLDKKRQ